MKIKICGLRTLEDISYVNVAMPDFTGFIFARGSKRKITIEQAELMKSALNKNIKSVGVFVDESPEVIISAAKLGIIDIIQMHGSETDEYIKEIKNYTKMEVIKAFKADENLNYNIENTNADYVLVDSFGKNSFGGTGNTFDWGLIPETNKKLFLAGGLNSENILEAIKRVKPYCVDINSGVETNGAKDKQKIIEIIQKIKGYENE